MNAKKIKAYLHADTETCTLDATTGKVREIGICITEFDLTPIRSDKVQPLNLISIPVDPILWDTPTWEWAKENYSTSELLRHVEHGKKDWRHVWTELGALFDNLVAAVEEAGYEPWLICNHTHFDVQFLQVMYKKLNRQFPIRYNRVLDLPSLVLGATGLGWIDYKTQQGRTKESTTHNALEDAVDQYKLLKESGIKLPA